MKDSLSTNGAAIRSVALFDDTVVLDCMSHVVDRIGDRLFAPEAQELVSSIVLLMAHSAKVHSVQLSIRVGGKALA